MGHPSLSHVLFAGCPEDGGSRKNMVYFCSKVVDLAAPKYNQLDAEVFQLDGIESVPSRFVAHFVFEIVNGSSGIQSTTTKQKPTHVNNGSRRKYSPGFKCDTEEDQPNETHESPPRGSHKPFKVEARIDIPSYDGTVDAEKLDSWLDQLETYFTLYGFTSTAKVSFARLKLTSHALAWWNAQLKMTRDEEIMWNEFKRLLRQEY
ncbi:hypothetical protein Tco_0980517, partial [Tanacetum coccineum]